MIWFIGGVVILGVIISMKKGKQTDHDIASSLRENNRHPHDQGGFIRDRNR